MRRTQPGFAAVDPPRAGGRRPRGRFRRERLEAPRRLAPGVGPTLRKRLAKLGLERAGDLLDHRPRRYEQPVARAANRRAVGRGRGRDRRRGAEDVVPPGPRPLQILTAQVADDSGQISATWFNQPWLAGEARAGHARPAPRCAESLRLPRALLRPDGGTATADFAPVYPASEEVARAKLRELVTMALPHARDYPGPAAAPPLKAERGLPLQRRRAMSLCTCRARWRRPSGDDSRLAFDELLTLQLALARAGGRARGGGRRGAAGARRADRALPRRAAVRAHRASGDRRSPSSTPTSRGRPRCSACCRATSARARPSSRCTRCLRAVEAGRQGALMAPTETLAEQHFLTIEAHLRAARRRCAADALVTGVDSRRQRSRTRTSSSARTR